MAKFVLKNAFLSIAGDDFSDHIESITLNYGAETPEQTSMGDGTRTRLPSFIDWSIDVSFRQDFAAANVDARLFVLVGAAAFAIVLRPDAGAKSASNPEFTGNALLTTYGILTGSVGDVANAPVTLMGDGALDRGV